MDEKTVIFISEVQKRKKRNVARRFAGGGEGGAVEEQK